nr:glycosyltransferase [Paracoccaceae bacterium]
ALAGLVGGVALAPMLALQLALIWILAANLATTALRLVAIFARWRGGAPATTSVAPRLVELKRLPAVSVLVPLKGEAAVAGQLLAAMARMEYPAPLLDIKLVLEAGDHATFAAIKAAGLPPTVEVVIVPPGSIQTKPRAMNYALPFCRGEIVGVYDAEDLPDPGQIRAVVQHLMEAAPEVACVQGYLDFYNTDRNWLSRCFTIEYAVWFRVLLHGVQRLGLPIPLGGTTVFFRRDALERIGAWDAHNVTEDADLGMRLARFGYRCEMIPTTTLEEANAASIGCWVRQRSRWLKGYAITWATHMRRPGALLDDLGWRGFLGFQVLFLGGMTSYLAMPAFWLLWIGALGFDLPLLEGLPGAPMAAFLFSMIAGKAVMLATATLALIDSGRLRMIPWLITLPLYWPLGALAAYRAVGELFYAPFHWHKTEHGPASARALRRSGVGDQTP